MISFFKPAVASVSAAVLLSAGFEASASAVLKDAAAVSQSVPALTDSQEEPDDPSCNLARLMKLTGADGRPPAGSRDGYPHSAPVRPEPPVFVKNPFLSTEP